MSSSLRAFGASLVGLALTLGCGGKNPANSPDGKAGGKCVVETTSRRHEVTVAGEFVLAFDGAGHLTRMDVKSGTTPPETLSVAATYDGAGRKKTETRVVSEEDSAQKESWSWTYEPNGRIARAEVTIEITGGPEKGGREIDSVTATKRDASGRPIRLERTLRSIPGDARRAEGDKETTLREVMDRTYAADGRIAREETKKLDADKVASTSGQRFEYDKAGHVVFTEVAEHEGDSGPPTQTLVRRNKFDAAGRLVHADLSENVGGEESTAVEDFEYDEGGHLVASRDEGDDKTFRYSGSCTPDLWDLFKAPEIYWADAADEKH